jgi:hypothetical protein
MAQPYSYGDKSESSAKSKHALWATKQMEAIDALLDPSIHGAAE